MSNWHRRKRRRRNRRRKRSRRVMPATQETFPFPPLSLLILLFLLLLFSSLSFLLLLRRRRPRQLRRQSISFFQHLFPDHLWHIVDSHSSSSWSNADDDDDNDVNGNADDDPYAPTSKELNYTGQFNLISVVTIDDDLNTLRRRMTKFSRRTSFSLLFILNSDNLS